MKIGYIITPEAITVTIDGISHTIPKFALNYQAVRKAIISGDDTSLVTAINSEGFIGALTEGKVTFKNGELKFQGHKIAPSIGKKLTTIINEGIPAMPWLKFVDRLLSNPSKRCLDNLYEFLDHKGMAISATGTCLGYKGVDDDYYSTHGNKNTIVIQGKVNDAYQIFNGVGETIEVARVSVDDDPSRGCSEGLHIGSFEYADSWAGNEGKLMLIEFDPKHAVSVPSDSGYQKLRVTKYEVINEITDNRKFLEEPVYSLNEDSEGNIDVHPLSRPELDKVADKIEDYHDRLETAIAIKKLASDNDVSMFDLINTLTQRGFEINWNDMENPEVSKNPERDWS